MQRNLLWTGREYYSLENCLVDTNSNRATIGSTIIGLHENKLYKVEYRIETDERWCTRVVEIDARHSNIRQRIIFEGDGNGHWKMDDKSAPEFDGCIDVDLPLTPFTNTLPIKRLCLGLNETQEIRVIYIDILSQVIIAVKQKYKRISDLGYHYENVPNDFEADIIVDEFGLVVDYPQLFVRTISLSGNYSNI